MAQSGARIVINYARQESSALEVKQAVEALGSEAMIAQADVSDEEQVTRMMASIKETFGPVTILVNNAGITRDGLLVRMKTSDWQQVLDTNLTSAFLMSRAVAKDMMKAKGGRIINISSVVGVMGNAGQANYSASKAGLIGLTKSLARELAPKHITVNTVAPGFIETEMTDALSTQVKEQLLAQIPLNQLGKAEDIAEAVAYLAGAGGRYITGQVLQVNGGMAM
ncbi:3-oxoacyl-[acyl-carrier-protein] reductase [Anoxynatronum buryatiense]|uniref:3-oxoacyl-[acyl-carrier-protein] reductase n=2 Tax=Anoxynatronum buryatiense TaxID=489973 RepID=A0AA45WXX7_9CLOT|nr:3-oxoacyl-[acyl-carrier-protein] reductase [Anoxynatronum buryatiense]